MELTEAAIQPDRGTSRPARARPGTDRPGLGPGSHRSPGRVVVVGIAPTPADEARAAASRGRNDLQRGRPDLAFQAVSQVRDESPEAGEAMAVAGLALIRMEQYPTARMSLERAP